MEPHSMLNLFLSSNCRGQLRWLNYSIVMVDRKTQSIQLSKIEWLTEIFFSFFWIIIYVDNLMRRRIVLSMNKYKIIIELMMWYCSRNWFRNYKYIHWWNICPNHIRPLRGRFDIHGFFYQYVTPLGSCELSWGNWWGVVWGLHYSWGVVCAASV